ncbi:hypothetical protein [Nitrosomonas sp.]|uniref:hypothetical protein n=1 Tax=Nitrosomonas sp. TaxID=42353 RepID=UPI001DA36379|nr:hypothetical protein [Nitrosomonas sp.]MBX3615620.1 hypothetical protein [Nitrosomonas sp.]
MRECISSVIKWLIENSGLAHWVTLFLLIISVCLAYNQLKGQKVQRQWQNFNEMNVRYAELLGKIPFKKEMKQSSDSFESVEEKTKIWIRQYFDLYSEECWLNEKGLLPKGMFNERIRSGVVVNLREYPILKGGYNYWKERDAFKHPVGFYTVVEEDIKRAEEKDPQNEPQDRCVKPIKPQSK